jgi:hypothetical protein
MQGIGRGKEALAERRRTRLAAELRANLKKRRDQARARSEREPPDDHDQGRDETRRS